MSSTVVTHIITIPPYYITSTSVMSGGKDIFVLGGGTISEKGIYYSAVYDNTNPLHGGVLSTGVAVTSESTTDDFVVEISKLLPNTKYYVIAYMKIGDVYYYGVVYSFFTLPSDAVTPPWCDETNVDVAHGQSYILPDGYKLVGIDYGGNAIDTLKTTSPDCKTLSL